MSIVNDPSVPKGCGAGEYRNRQLERQSFGETILDAGVGLGLDVFVQALKSVEARRFEAVLVDVSGTRLRNSM